MEERPAVPPPPALCWSCSARIDAEDNFCRRCGKGQGAHVPWYYQHWGIIAATVLGLGPFGLILVWRSPRLGKEARWGYTAVIVLVTWWTSVQLYRAWLIVQAAAQNMMQGLGL